MKTLAKIFLAIVLTLASTTMFTSCFGLLDPDNYEYGWTEDANKLTYKVGVGIYTIELIFEFENDVCVKATEKISFSSASLARAFYDELDSEEKAEYKLSGKTLTCDITEDYRGLTKAQIKGDVEADEWE